MTDITVLLNITEQRGKIPVLYFCLIIKIMKKNNFLSQIALALYSSSENGAIKSYYEEAGYWQGPLRNDVSRWRESVLLQSEIAEDRGNKCLRTVNSRYKTRASIYDLSAIYDHALKTLLRKMWLQNAPCFYKSADVSGEIAEMYMEALLASCTQTRNRNFSLMSKWLHLSLPETFPIYDQRVVASIKTWSDMTHSHLSPNDMERLQYNTESKHWVSHWRDPRWYTAILKFYQLLWQEAVDLGITEDLTHFANEIEIELQSHIGASRAKLTVSSLIDTHLWLADGDTKKLTK